MPRPERLPTDEVPASSDHATAPDSAPGIAEPPEGWDGPRAVAYTAPQALPDPAHDLSDPDLPYWLALSRVKGIGPARFKLLLDAFGTAEAV